MRVRRLAKTTTLTIWNAQGLALLPLIIGLTAGCKKSNPPADSQATPVPQSAVQQASVPLAQLHWLGKKRIGMATNNAFFTNVWNLPETARLQDMVLDKLATAPWRSHQPHTQSTAQQESPNSSTEPTTNQTPATTNSALGIPRSPLRGTLHSAVPTNSQPSTLNPQLSGPSALLRPLLDDLVNEEWVLQLQQGTAGAGQFVLAIRLDTNRAELWETNAGAVIESLTNAKRQQQPGGWKIEFTEHEARNTNSSPTHAVLVHVGDWTLLGFSQPGNSLFTGLRDRITRAQATFPPPTDHWLEIENLDLNFLSRAFGTGPNSPTNLPKLSLTVTSEADSVRTRAQLDFPAPLPLKMEAWNVPTNLISSPLISFTAIRGFGPWLASSKLWQALHLGPPPNQLYTWASTGPMQSYFASPDPDASNQVSRLTDLILEKTTPYLGTNDVGSLGRAENTNRIQWRGLPVMSPFLDSVDRGSASFIFGGLFPPPPTNVPPPVELLAQFLGQNNLVLYDWELTGLHAEQWIGIGQFIRFAIHRQQIGDHSASREWLRATSTKLGNCGTAIFLTAPNQLGFMRRAGIGFTALELHLLADWFESPDFPYGLHSFAPATSADTPMSAPTAPTGP